MIIVCVCVIVLYVVSGPNDSINIIGGVPWTDTTHHFIIAMKGKYQLSVCCPAGCVEGFLYTQVTRLNAKAIIYIIIELL